MQLLCCVLRFSGYLFYLVFLGSVLLANVNVRHKFEWLFIVGRRQIGFIIWASVIEIRFNAFAKYMRGSSMPTRGQFTVGRVKKYMN